MKKRIIPFIIMTICLIALSACNTSLSKPVDNEEITQSIQMETNEKNDKNDKDNKSDKNDKNENKKEKSTLHPVRVGNQYGYIDNKGDMILQPQFDRAGEFSEGLANVVIGDKAGYIGIDGKYVINPRFNQVGQFSDGLAPIYAEEGIGFINKSGEIIVEPQFDRVENFSDGLATVCLTIEEDGIMFEERCGYLNQAGEIQINYQYSATTPFYQGVAIVSSIDTDNGFNHGEWGIINKEGEYILEPQFDDAGEFADGLAPVKIDEKWGYVDKKGDIVISTKYDRTFSFSEGLGGFCNYEGEGEYSGLYSCGFLTKSGKEVIHLDSYYHVGGDRGGDPWATVDLAFSEGMAEIRVEDKIGYINKKGEFLIEPQFNYASPFNNGFADVSIDSESAVINKKGEIVWSE